MKKETKLITAKRAADILGVTSPTIKSLALAGRVSYTQIGSRVYFTEQDVLDFKRFYVRHVRVKQPAI